MLNREVDPSVILIAVGLSATLAWNHTVYIFGICLAFETSRAASIDWRPVLYVDYTRLKSSTEP